MMKANFFLVILLAIASPVWANGQSGSGPSATAVGVQNQSATMISAPTLAPNASASSNSNQSTTVGVQANPTAVGGGGTGVGLGGSSSALAVGGDQYMVLDQRNFSKVYNRQFYQARIDQSPNTMQYYGRFEKRLWNVAPIIRATWRVNPRLKKKIKYFRLVKNIYKKNNPVSRVTIARYGTVAGSYVGDISVVVTEEQTTADALEIIKSEAAKNGANVIEIVASDAIIVPTSEGWHVGTGAGASGIVGLDEKASISGAGGTGYGKSTITRESRPFITARLWVGTIVHRAMVTKKAEANNASKIDVKKLEEK